MSRSTALRRHRAPRPARRTARGALGHDRRLTVLVSWRQLQIVKLLLTDLERDGYVVVPDLLDADGVTAVREALAPHPVAGPEGATRSRATQTQEGVLPGGQIAHVFDRLILDSVVLPVAEQVLGENLLLTASPPSSSSPVRRPRTSTGTTRSYPLPRPRPPVSLSVMWAIDDFSADNGATVLFPGSHTWSEDELTEDGRTPIAAEMYGARPWSTSARSSTLAGRTPPTPTVKALHPVRRSQGAPAGELSPWPSVWTAPGSSPRPFRS